MADQDGRSKCWSFILYPESMPDNWLSILRDLHTIGAISPLHDKDILDKNTGELKKPHYHVVLMFPSKKSPNQILNIQNKLGSNVYPIAIDNFEGMIRYLIHQDDPEKAQYDFNNIIPLAGLDLKGYFLPPKSQVVEIMNDITQFLLDNPSIIDFENLMYHASTKKDWIYVLNNIPCYGPVRILNSRRWKIERKEKHD